jgi:regulator of PEP synthase PpsR (kinase-PPPase family)
MSAKKKRPAGKASQANKIFLVAEGTGETISKITKSALAQFGTQVKLEKFVQVTTKQEIRKIAKLAAQAQALVAFSIVEKSLRECLLTETEKLAVTTIDVIGDLIIQFSRFLAQEPLEIPGRQHLVDDDYYQRMEAVNFAVKHDDGKSPGGLKNADLVVTGLSRTGKTPLATYLAHQGWKVANVPLHPEMDAPDELFQVAKSKVFGLTIKVENLVKVRQSRLEQLGLSQDAKYADPVKISDELDWCKSFFKKHRGWHIVDISNKAVEEIAATILKLYPSSP